MAFAQGIYKNKMKHPDRIGSNFYSHKFVLLTPGFMSLKISGPFENGKLLPFFPHFFPAFSQPFSASFIPAAVLIAPIDDYAKLVTRKIWPMNKRV
jgi:hypothetical protein